MREIVLCFTTALVLAPVWLPIFSLFLPEPQALFHLGCFISFLGSAAYLLAKRFWHGPPTEGGKLPIAVPRWIMIAAMFSPLWLPLALGMPIVGTGHDFPYILVLMAMLGVVVTPAAGAILFVTRKIGRPESAPQSEAQGQSSNVFWQSFKSSLLLTIPLALVLGLLWTFQPHISYKAARHNFPPPKAKISFENLKAYPARSNEYPLAIHIEYDISSIEDFGEFFSPKMRWQPASNIEKKEHLLTQHSIIAWDITPRPTDIIKTRDGSDSWRGNEAGYKRNVKYHHRIVFIPAFAYWAKNPQAHYSSDPGNLCNGKRDDFIHKLKTDSSSRYEFFLNSPKNYYSDSAPPTFAADVIAFRDLYYLYCLGQSI